MEKLLSGVLRFKNDVYPSQEVLFSELASGQSPEVLMVTCADSRIDPAMITQTDPGDVFICRNAGNIVPPYRRETESNTASIEFAVKVLGIKDIIICGHSDCGAMKGALNPEGLTAVPHVAGWLAHSATAAASARKRCVGGDDAELLKEVTETNVVLQMLHLRTHPYIAEGLAEGSLNLHGWVYNIGEGSIKVYNEKTDTFEPYTKKA